jgi:Mn2+/Fe2+ NRAMP family transporter
MVAQVSRPRAGLLSAQRVIAVLFAVALLASGLWAMLAPESFYATVAQYPPYNRHFIHDIGAFMLGLGATLGFGLALADALLVALAGNSIGAIAHFISHLVDRDLGGQPNDPLIFGVFALLLAGLAVWRWRLIQPAPSQS